MLKKIWNSIPENLDILVTHGTSYQTLDYSDYQSTIVGCEVLQREIYKKMPKIHVFGHIHEARCGLELHGIKYYNCSVLDWQYKLVNKPTIIEIQEN